MSGQMSRWGLGLGAVLLLALAGNEKKFSMLNWAKGVKEDAREKKVGGKAMKKSDFLQDVIKCPTNSTEELAKKNLIAGGTKYFYRYSAKAADCRGEGLWALYTINDHEKILHRMAKTLGVKKGDLVLDWGSGCGHKLMMLNKHYGALGLGIDYCPPAVKYATNQKDYGSAQTEEELKYCEADGSDMEWVPTEAFDHVITHGALYHLPKDMQCATIVSLLRVLKKGGIFINAYADEVDSPRSLWSECLGTFLDPSHYTWTFRNNWNYTGVRGVYSEDNFAVIIHNKGNSDLPDFTEAPLEHK